MINRVEDWLLRLPEQTFETVIDVLFVVIPVGILTHYVGPGAIIGWSIGMLAVGIYRGYYHD